MKTNLLKKKKIFQKNNKRFKFKTIYKTNLSTKMQAIKMY